ncbi:prefoldin subunit alpha [Methanobrevibacter cuticularis]|uniref:Prefoldin subunit alpha n=1 Tax=Methanobrevibacter cuticularis TaxID=47311 RepID=A0A166EKR8_9EURY|nr:prefoldin subunit alpha [Methanobrevibacter cuticularis]KZX16764.1 prefoldin subunit alpha [Methanobrevibacter cuticularis]
MEDQQRLEEMMNELNLYKSQAEMLQQQVEAVQSSIAEVEILESTLEDVKDKNSLETLVPVGAGSFMNAEITKTNEIIMSVGAGIAIPKTIEEAKETMASQKEELNESLDKMVDNLQKISQIVAQLSPQAEELMRKVQSGQQAPI